MKETGKKQIDTTSLDCFGIEEIIDWVFGRSDKPC